MTDYDNDKKYTEIMHTRVTGPMFRLLMREASVRGLGLASLVRMILTEWVRDNVGPEHV